MTLPILPDWLPGWAIGLAIAVGALYLLVLLAMPFSVFGLKGRLDEIEARLDDIHAEIRGLSLRLPEGAVEVDTPPGRPPIPPPRTEATRSGGLRAEPRLDRPR